MSSERARRDRAPSGDDHAAVSSAVAEDRSPVQESAPEQVWLSELFDKHGDVIFNYCYRRTGDLSDAEDLLSTVFMSAWRRRQDVPAGRELPWLYGVATNAIRNHRRGQRRLARLLQRLSSESAVGHGPTFPLADGLDSSRTETLLRAVNSLRPAERDVFVLCAWQGLSYEEASDALGVPVGTIRSRLSRGRAQLRELTEHDRT